MKKITTAFIKAKNKTENRTRQVMKVMMFAFVSLLCIEGANAQISIPSAVAVTENFTIGTTATASLPTGFKIGTNWTTGTTATTIAYGTTGTGAVTGTSSGGVINWANGVTASATDRSIGFLTTGSFSSPRSIMYAFTNNTGATVTSIVLAWNYEKSRSGSRAFDWTFFHGNTSTASTSASEGNQSYAADTNNTVISNPPLSTAKSFTLTGLSIANGATYYLRWTYTGVGGSTNSQGLSIDDFSITLPSAGSVPSAPTITGITSGDTQLSVAFTAGGDGGSAITNYEYSINGGGNFIALSPLQTTSPIVINGLTNGTSYNVQIRAVNSVGQGTSTTSTVATPYTTPSAPAITAITPGNTQLSVVFTPGADGGSAIINYEYSTNGGSNFTTVSPAQTASPIIISGLTNGTIYNVQIRAISSFGKGAVTASLEAIPYTVAATPIINGITAGNTQLSLAFTAGDDGGSAITNYQYSTDNGSSFTAFSPAQTTSPIVISGLTNGTTYSVQLKAVNSAGTSTATATTTGTPEAPVSPTISASVSSINALSTTYGTASSTASFTLSGATLDDSITVTPPAGFEVSTSLDFLSNTGTNASPLVIGAAPTVPTTTVYVRFMATAGVSGTYNNQNIALTSTNAETVHVTTASSGNTVSAKTLTIAGIAGDNKVYDATTSATVSGTPTYVGLENNESFSVTGTPVFTFTSKSIGGRAITVTGNYDAPSANYTVLQPSGLSATITTATLTITDATATPRAFNNTTDVAVTGSLIGVLLSDSASLNTTGTIATVNAGLAKMVTYSINGADASNYTLTQPGTTVDITQASQTITFDQSLTYTTATTSFPLTATATSGLAVAYTSSNRAVAEVIGSAITIIGAGTATITAIQVGDTNYSAATSVARTLTVTLTPVTIYQHNFDTGATVSPYTVLPTATSPAGILNSNFTSTSFWTSSNSAFTNFVGSSGQSLVIQPANGLTSSMTLTLNVASGYQASISSFNFWRRRTSSGPNISSITINENQVLGSSSVPTTGASLGSTAVSNSNNLTGTLTVVINLTAPTGSSQNLRLDDFTLTGNLTCATPAAPTVSDLTVAFDGAAKSVTASVGGSTTVDWYDAETSGNRVLENSLTSPANTNAGTYTYYAEARNTVCGAVSTSRTMVTVTINKANAILSVSNPIVLFTGVSQSATVSSTVLGTVSNILTGGTATQAALGTYAVTASFVPNDTANYNTLTGATVGNFEISETSTWNGSSWNLDLPTSSMNAIIAADYGTNNGLINVKNLTVNSGVRFTVNAGADGAIISENITNNGFIVVENNANLIQTAAGADTNISANDATVLVHRKGNHLKRLDYTLWSAPVSGDKKLFDFSPLTTPSRNYEYRPDTNLYRSVGNQGTFAAGKGYLIRMPDTQPGGSLPVNQTPYYTGNAPLTYEGAFWGKTLNNGTITIPTTSNTFNAIGNPYPSTISADAFLNANDTAGMLYFWRKTNGVNGGSAYATYTRAGSTATGTNKGSAAAAPDGSIQVGQGFIVKATENQLVFNNNMRATPSSSEQFFKVKQQQQKDRIWLNLTGTNDTFSQALVAYIDDATLGLDQYDGKYINDSEIALTSNIAGDEFTIQARPAFDAADVVALNFKTSIAGTFNIAIDHVDGLFAKGQDIYLVDKTAGVTTNLNEGAYSFTAAAGIDNTRFTLAYQKTLKIDAPLFNENSVLVSRNNGTVNVKSTAVAINNVKVFDIQGRLVAERKNVNSNTASIANLKANQVLIVKVTSENNAVVTKKVLN